MHERLIVPVLFLGQLLVGLGAGSATEWEFTGGPTGARVLVFERAPNGDILAGLYPHGVARREPGVTEWQPAGFDGVQVRFLYTASNGAVFATGSERDGLAWTHFGVFRSLDDGHTWEIVSAGLDGSALNVNSLAETSDGLLLAATSGGLFAFSDSQSSWQPRGFSEPLWNLVANPQGDLFALAGGRSDRFLRSEDGGETWGEIVFAEPLQSIAAGPDGVVVATADTVFSGACTVFVSTDRGRTFVCADETLDVHDANTALVRLDGEILIGATPIYPGGGGIWHSNDFGQTWNPAGLNEASVSTLSHFHDSGYWVRAENLVYRADEDFDWHLDQQGLVDTTVLSIVPTPEGLVVGGIEFGVQRWAGAHASWEQLGLEFQWVGSGLWTRDGQLLVSAQRGEVKRFLAPGQWEDYRLVGQADSLVELPDGRICGTGSVRITCASPGTGDPNRCETSFEQQHLHSVVASGDGSLVAKTVRYGGNQTSLYHSGDGGCSWTETWSAEVGLAVALAGGRDGVVYAAMKNGEVWRSGDGGLEWELRGMLDDWPTDLVIDRWGRLFAATFEDELFVSNGGLYASSDDGETWWEFFDLPDGVTINRLAVDGGWLYAEPHQNGKGLGIFRTFIGRVMVPSEPPTSAVD